MRTGGASASKKVMIEGYYIHKKYFGFIYAATYLLKWSIDVLLRDIRRLIVYLLLPKNVATKVRQKWWKFRFRNE